MSDLGAPNTQVSIYVPSCSHMSYYEVLCSFPLYYDVYVEYNTCDGGSPRIGMIGTLKEVKDLARKAGYQGGTAHLELKREFGCGKSSVRLMVRKVSVPQ